jgi:hypothetical protein
MGDEVRRTLRRKVVNASALALWPKSDQLRSHPQRVVSRQASEILGGGGLRPSLGMKLRDRRDRRLERQPVALAGRHHLVTPAVDLDQLTDVEVQPFHRGSHATSTEARWWRAPG